jgi:hypothetical protein
MTGVEMPVGVDGDIFLFGTELNGAQNSVAPPEIDCTQLSSSLSSLGSTPSLGSPPTMEDDASSLDISLLQTQLAAYNEIVHPGASFWVEINPHPQSFDRDSIAIDHEEFHIIGIFGEVGEGNDLLYEVQFEDDHTAIVCPLITESSDIFTVTGE